MKAHDEHGPAEADDPISEIDTSDMPETKEAWFKGARYVPNGTPLTPHEAEILHCLQEECAEVIQAASKLLRFGKENRPDDTGAANTYVLAVEMGEVLCMLEMAAEIGLVDHKTVDANSMLKRQRLKYFMQTDPLDQPFTTEG